jgi:ribosomal protein L11 methyltransferase
MSPTAWAEIACHVPESLVDPLADFLIDLTGTGVSIDNRSVDTFSPDDIVELPSKTVKAYVTVECDLEQVLARISSFLTTAGASAADYTYQPPTVTIIQEEDWANTWKAHFKPTRIGRRLVIKPSWEEYAAAAGDVVLELDPGMAFGTGTHGTTRLCLEALERIMCREGIYGDATPPERATVLDVGCGSGVLSIAAAKLGSRQVEAVDIDPVAVQVTTENAGRNDVGPALSVSTAPLADLASAFDIVLANILAEELVRLAHPLVGRVAPHGHLILSGILREREAFVIEGFAPFPVILVETTHSGDWSCLVYRKAP